MTRKEYLTGLQKNLNCMPIDERQNILQYYAEYFDDAGVENEQKVMEELGTPEQLAAKIMADFKSGTKAYQNSSYQQGSAGCQSNGYQQNGAYQNNSYQQGNGAYQNNGYQQGNGGCQNGSYQNNSYNTGAYEKNVPKKKSYAWLIVLLAVISCPIWFSLVITAGSLFLAAVVMVISLLFAVAAVGVSLVVAGIASVGGGIAAIPVHIPTAVITVGFGLCSAGAGLLILALFILIAYGVKELIVYLVSYLKRKKQEKRGKTL